MAEFAQLVLQVDARGVKAGTAALDGLETQARQTERATVSMNTAGKATGPAFSMAGNGARMLTQQLSQVGQQTMATGNFMQALAIQLPDIGLAFGAVGTAVGLLAGIGLPILASALGDTSEETQTLSDRLDAMTGAVKDYRDAAADAAMTSEELAATYGVLSTQAQQALEAIADVRLFEALEAIRTEAQNMQEAFAGFSGFDAFTGEYISNAEGLAEAMETSAVNAQILLTSITLLGQADDMAELADYGSSFLQDMDRTYGTIEAMPPAMRELYEQVAAVVASAAEAETEMNGVQAATARAMLDAMGLNAQASLMSANFSNVAGAAWGIVSALSAAVTEAVTLSNAQAAFRQENLVTGVTEDERGNTGNIANAIHNDLRAAAVERYGSALTGVGRAAGGAARATEELASISDTLDDILRDAADPVQEWRDGLQSIADNGIGGVADAVRDFGQSGFEDFSGFMDGMVDAAATAVEEITAQFASRQLASALGSFAGPIGGLLGSLAGGLFGSLFGGGGSTPYEETEQYDIDQEKAALIRQMHELEGHSNYLKRQEIEAYDESNQALARKVQLLEEEAAIEAERQSLQMQLWELEGNTEAIRAAQLEQLDESNRALQEQIWAQQDLAAATEETTRAIEEAIAAISPDDYSTQFAYDRAIALAKNGYIPATGTTQATAATAQEAQVEQTAAMNSQLAKLSNLMSESLTILRQWNANGLPPEAA